MKNKYVVGIGYKKEVKTTKEYKEYAEMIMSELNKIAIRHKSLESIKTYRPGLDICFVFENKDIAWDFHDEARKMKQITETTHLSLEEVLKRTEKIV